MTKAIICCAALTLSNFLYQSFGTFDWSTAFERSLFQTIAILIFIFAFREEINETQTNTTGNQETP